MTASDAGRRLRVRVTATNADGSATAASNATALIKAAPSAPSNTKPPTISGDAIVGATLTANPGQWTQQPSFRYEWRRCDQNGSSCAAISGATERTYVLKSVDQGNTLRVRVEATSSGTMTAATSVPTAVVRPAAAPAPAANGCPAGSGAIQANQLSAPARLLIAGQVLEPSLVTGGTGEPHGPLPGHGVRRPSRPGCAALRHRGAVQPVHRSRAADRRRRLGDAADESPPRLPGKPGPPAAPRDDDAGPQTGRKPARRSLEPPAHLVPGRASAPSDNPGRGRREAAPVPSVTWANGRLNPWPRMPDRPYRAHPRARNAAPSGERAK